MRRPPEELLDAKLLYSSNTKCKGHDVLTTKTMCPIRQYARLWVQYSSAAAMKRAFRRQRHCRRGFVDDVRRRLTLFVGTKGMDECLLVAAKWRGQCM